MTRSNAVHVLELTAQDGGQQEQVVAPPHRDRPLLSGEARDLWAGAGLLVLAFLAITAFLMVWRVGGAKSQRKKRNAELFQPAGQNAEITFEDDGQPPQLTKQEQREQRKREKAERAAAAKALKTNKTLVPKPERVEMDAARAADEAEVVIERDAAEPARAPAPKKSERRSQPFSALFSRKKKPELYASGTLDLGADNPSADQARLHPLATERRRPKEEERPEPPAEVEAPSPRRPVRAEAEEAHRLAERLEDERRQDRSRLEAAEEMRRKAIDDARQNAERLQNDAEISRRAETTRLQAEAEAREEARRRNYEREAEFERRKQLAAIEQRERELRRAETANESLWRELTLEVERKIETLAARLPDRMTQATAFAEVPPADPALLRAVDRIARDLANQRSALDEAVGALSSRIEEIGQSARNTEGLRHEMAGLKRALTERFAGPSAPLMQLDDIMRNALPPDAYDLRVMLSNNRRADCVVRLPNPPGPVAIDGRFPVEAFQKLHADEAQDQAAAENEFRRTALRHIVDIAERLIIPGETADSAMMFLPSETMHTELLARFQDLVQDSYRARVWIVSPTTLMATLQTMRAVMREGAKAQAAHEQTLAPTPNESEQVLSEVEALRRRVVSLESSFDRVREEVREIKGPPPAPKPQAAEPPPALPAFLAGQPEAAVANGAHAPAQEPATPAPAPSASMGAAAAATLGAPAADRPPPAFLLPPVPPVR